MSEGSVGQRVFIVRRDLGDGWKNPMPQAEFAALLSKKAGRVYDSAMVSRIENGERKVSLEEVDWIASLDPKKRGRAWLGWNEKPADGAGRVLVDVNEDVTNAQAKRDAAKKPAAKGGRRPG